MSTTRSEEAPSVAVQFRAERRRARARSQVADRSAALRQHGDTATNQCNQCLAKNDCPNGQTCDPLTKTCEPRVSDNDCATNESFNPVAHKCDPKDDGGASDGRPSDRGPNGDGGFKNGGGNDDGGPVDDGATLAGGGIVCDVSTAPIRGGLAILGVAIAAVLS